jgi:hypothetical protein
MEVKEVRYWLERRKVDTSGLRNDAQLRDRLKRDIRERKEELEGQVRATQGEWGVKRTVVMVKANTTGRLQAVICGVLPPNLLSSVRKTACAVFRTTMEEATTTKIWARFAASAHDRDSYYSYYEHYHEYEYEC